MRVTPGILFAGTLVRTIQTSFVTGAELVMSVAPTGICGDLVVEGLGFTSDESVRVVVRKAGQNQLLAGPVSVHAAGSLPASTGLAGDRLIGAL